MVKQEFVKEISALYGSYSGFEISELNEDCEIIISFEDVKIILNSDDTFDIWCIFLLHA